jgi:DNA modification methylase
VIRTGLTNHQVPRQSKPIRVSPRRPQKTGSKSRRKSLIAYRTTSGRCFNGHAENVLRGRLAKSLKGKVDLILTSPPFPLNRKKKYKNLQGKAYIRWLKKFAPLFKKLLRPKGSIVMELGNSWKARSPVMSTLALESLLAFLRAGKFNLCQQLVWYNPAKLPTPAQWVTIERIRLKDSFTHLWWMSPSDRPKADNRRVLVDYSDSMRRLLKTKKYNSGRRPSQHYIGKKSFFTNNKGAIPSNVLTSNGDELHESAGLGSVITLSNTYSSTDYQEFCRRKDIEPHPARMPLPLAEFFVKLLTEPNDLVLDPFGGSNTTGRAAENLKRRWITIEPNQTYIKGSRGRFRTKRKR